MPATTYIAEPLLEIDGKTASNELMEDILQISVEESLHLPGMFVLVIKNDYFSGRSVDAPWQYDDLFQIGKTIKIGFSGSTTAAQDFDDQNQGYVLDGEITGMETNFTSSSQAPIVIRGYDISHRLHRGRYNRSFQNMTDTDVVKKVIGEVGIPAGTIDNSGSPHDYIFQENQTNMEFLRERAARNGFELYVQDGKMNFRKPKANSNISLTWLKDLHSFRVRVTSAEQVKSVEVRGWDYERKEAIVSTKNVEKLLTSTDHGSGQKQSTIFNGKPTTPKMIVVDQPVFSAKEADTIAQALIDELGGEFVVADARAEGNPDLRTGQVVQLKDMGKYSGKYYITETRHLFQDRVYSTEFSVRGLRGGDLLSTLAPSQRLQAGQTLLVGKVTNNKDPKGWGRVRVKFPTLTEEHESNWARMVASGAGKDRGFDCLPEVDDEVLVGFEHGDIHRPYIMGGVWNGKDSPPEKVDSSIVDGKVNLRTVKTRTGHTLQFVEEDKDANKKGVYLDTVYGHHLYLNDSEKFTELKTKEGHYARLDDQGKKLEIKSKGGHKVLLDDNGSAKIDMISTGDINVKSGTSGSSRKISLNAGEITLTATTKITLKVGSSSIELSNSGVTIQGVQAAMKGTAQTKIEGALVTVQASGVNSIKGSIVKIN